MTAREYAQRHGLHALVVARDGRIEHATYAGGYDAGMPHALYSGTKSFWGPVALIAERQGVLRLDERVAETFPQWDADDRKARVTLRMLLSLTAGFGFGGLGSGVPTYDAALEMQLHSDPGTRFAYGGIALQVFGAVLSRKLSPLGSTPVEFLRAHVLDEARCTIGSWRTLSDGTHALPTGAHLTALDWLAYGEWVLAHRDALTPCFQGTDANPRYGLGWWLAPKGAPSDLVYASGAAGQGLYLVPSQRLAVVHFGKSGSFKHDAFLRRLLTG